jgi:hypothetical protein
VGRYLGKHPNTIYRFDWAHGHTIEKYLSRSFDTLEEAQRFAEGKRVVDIYISKGRYKVQWVNVIDNNA